MINQCVMQCVCTHAFRVFLGAPLYVIEKSEQNKHFNAAAGKIEFYLWFCVHDSIEEEKIALIKKIIKNWIFRSEIMIGEDVMNEIYAEIEAVVGHIINTTY